MTVRRIPSFLVFILLVACSESDSKTPANQADSAPKTEIPKLIVQQLKSGHLLKYAEGDGMEVLYAQASGSTMDTAYTSLNGIVFAESSSQLDLNQSENKLRDLSELLKSFPAVRASFIGLSGANEIDQLRTRALSNFLVENGVNPSQLELGSNKANVSDSQDFLACRLFR